MCAGVWNDCIVEGTWQTLVVQYDPITFGISMRMGDQNQDWVCSRRNDRTFEKMILGGNPINIAGFYAVDKFLSMQEVSSVINNIYLKNDLFDTWCSADCDPGYSVDMFTMACEFCPIGPSDAVSLISGHYCNGCIIPPLDQRSANSEFECLCNGVSSLHECSCIAGSPSPLVGTSNEVALLRNTAQFESRVNRFSTPRWFSGSATFEITGGPGTSELQKNSAVVFDANTHFLNAASLHMKIGTNGFTAVAVVKFTGIVDGARIFQFGSIHNAWDNLVVARSGMSNSLVFRYR